MKFILCPDSYKNNISSVELCDIMKRAILQASPKSKVLSIPIADGGEGTLDAISLAFSSRKDNLSDVKSFDITNKAELIKIKNEGEYKYIFADIVDPFLKPIKAEYLFNGECAIIESAKAIGISLVAENLDVKNTSTYGLGQLIKHALDNGAKTIVLALGGSSTSDLGAGMASALGYKFLDKDNNAFIPTAKNLDEVKVFDNSGAYEKIFETKFIAMVDCKNPLLGKEGATYVYSKQKGASDKDIPILEKKMESLATLLSKTYGNDFILAEGAGAAGGLGAAVNIFLDANLQSGIDTLLDLISFEKILKDADLVITGEGRFDYQSLMGKAISGIAKRAKPLHVSVVVIAGQSEIKKSDNLEEFGITAVYPINESDLSNEEKIKRSREDVYLTTKKALEEFIKS